MLPLRTRPVTSTRRISGTPGAHGLRTFTLPLPMLTSSASTTTPGRVTIVMLPLRTSASIRTTGLVRTASVKSSLMFPLVTAHSMRWGTTQRPLRWALPLVTLIRTTSRGSGAGPGASPAAPGAAGRSAVSAASSL